MQIRLLGPDDASAYRTLRLRALWEFPEAFTSSFQEDENQPMQVWEIRLAGEHARFWGAFESDQLCGMVGLECETRSKNRHKGNVVGMYVSQEYFGTGMGRALMEALLSVARREGVDLLVLTVTEGNTVATHFYEASGFRSWGIEPRAIKVDGRFHAKNHMYLELTPS